MPPVRRRSGTEKEEPSPHAACPHNHPRNGIGRGACGKNGIGKTTILCEEETVGVIIIAVFWLLGLLTVWSMCVVSARADRHMEELHHAGGVSNGKGSANPPV